MLKFYKEVASDRLFAFNTETNCVLELVEVSFLSVVNSAEGLVDAIEQHKNKVKKEKVKKVKSIKKVKDDEPAPQYKKTSTGGMVRIKGDRWSLKFDACLGCGTKEKKHMGHGYCTTCYPVKVLGKIKQPKKLNQYECLDCYHYFDSYFKKDDLACPKCESKSIVQQD